MPEEKKSRRWLLLLVFGAIGVVALFALFLTFDARQLSTEDLFKMAGSSVVLIEVFDDEGQKQGIGSGFVASKQAIVTNYHVIRAAHRAVARFPDGSSAPILGIYGYDPKRDVAVLAAGRVLPPPLKLGNSDGVRVGEKVVAIGSPLGLQNTITEGVVSGVRSGLIQMSAPISPGSSGGPVISSRGEVIAVAVASVQAGQNLNFAVPINWARAYFAGAASRPLAEVARENTVIEKIIDGTISIPAREMKSWTINVDSNRMSNAELHGKFECRRELFGEIRMTLLRGNRTLYDSGRTTQGEIHQRLAEDGTYALVIDANGLMSFSAVQVTAHIGLRYVR